ncbi:PKD domain-containing protein [Candidatus Bipolaricaulota bacterium]
MRKRAIILTGFLLLFIIAVPTFAPNDPPLTVVINEVCWAGAAWDHTAEWIELFNTTNAPIALDGWQLVSSDGAPHIRLQGVIHPSVDGSPSSGYYLLERLSDKSVPDIAADAIYQGALTNSGETLTLIDASGRIIDTANASLSDDSADAWPAGSDDRGTLPFATMERVQFAQPDEPANWESCTAVTLEASDEQVSGTPKAENSAYNDLPVAQMTITPPIPHPGIPAEFDATGSDDPNDPITSYRWEFGDGTEATGPAASHTYQEAGEYAVTLILTDSKGGETQFTRDVQVALTTAPIADFSVVLKPDQDVARASDLLTFQDESSDADSEITSWKWHFGDGHDAAGRSVNHSYETYGEYVVGLRVVDAQGEVGVQTRSLSIASRSPVAVFSFSPERPNQSQIVRFDATESFDPDGEITVYQWDFDGDGTIDSESAEPIAEYEYMSGGRFTPSLQVIDDLSQRSTRERMIDVNAAPKAQFQISSFEPRELELVTATDLSDDSDGIIVQWLWDFGDGTVSDEASPSHVYQQNGTMDITLTVTDEQGAAGTAVASINVGNLPPVANLTVAEATLPTGSRFSFDASASFDPSPLGSLARYEWSLGREDVYEVETSVPSLAHVFGDDGQVTVRVRVTDSDGASAVSEPLSITVSNRSPTISRVTWSPSEPADGDDVTFAVQASDPDGEITAWTWTLNSGERGSSQNFLHSFEDDGDYSLSIQVRDNDGASSNPYSISVPIRNAPPVAQFTAVQGSACGTGSVRFDASASFDPSPTGRIVHVAWSFGDGANCPGSSAGCSDSERLTPEHCYSAPGTYIVTLVVIDEHGAMSSTSKTILIGE